MRATRPSAVSAAARVASSPSAAAIASTNSAGSFFGARPLSLISTRATHDARAVLRQRGDHRRRALARQLALTDVERSALGAEHEEAIESRPVIDRPGEPAGGVGDLRGTGNGLGLRRREMPEASRDVLREIEHGSPS